MTKPELDKLLNSAQQLRMRGDIESAIDLIIEAINITPPSTPLLTGLLAILGFWLFEAGRYKEAVPLLEEVVFRKPTKEEVSRALFHCFFNLRKIKKAFKEMERFLKISNSKEYESILVKHGIRYGLIKDDEDKIDKNKLLFICNHMEKNLHAYYENLLTSNNQRGQVE